MLTDEECKKLFEGDDESDELWNKLREMKVTPRQRAFLFHYFLEGADTFQEPEKAFKEVYDSEQAKKQAAKLMRMPKIKKAAKLIKKWLNPEIFNGLYVKREWLWQYNLAKKDGRFKDCINILDKISKITDIYGEGQTVDNTQALEARKHFAQVSMKDENKILEKLK